MNSDIFRIRNHALLAQRRGLRSDSLQTDGAHSCNCCQCAAALLLSFGLIEIRNPLLGHDMADVVAVNHYRRDRHSCLLADFHRVEGINERGDAAFLKCPYSLDHELSPTNNRPLFRDQVKPRWRTMSAAVRVVSHVGCAAKSR